MLSRYAPSHLFLRILLTHMLLMTIPIHDVILGCFDICLICLDKTLCVIYLQTNLLCFMIALEKPFRYALRLSLMVGFLVRHAIFEII